MSKPAKRTYTSTFRTSQAELTRQGILAAAQNLFKDKGFEGVTIADIAEAASVSAPTVYAIFKSKRGVLFALMDSALPAEIHANLVEQIMQEKSAPKSLRISAKIARMVYDAESEQLGSLAGTTVIAPEFQELEKKQEERRYERQREFIELLGGRGVLKEGVTVTDARDIHWALTGRDMYRLFVVKRGWASDKYEEWLGTMLIDHILELPE